MVKNHTTIIFTFYVDNFQDYTKQSFEYDFRMQSVQDTTSGINSLLGLHIKA